jgi:hypothetical protein
MPPTAIQFLSILFNNCINNSYFPKSWKIAKLIPIHKKSKDYDIKNFRPVSLTPNIGKILEKIIETQMNKFLSNFEVPIISDYQFGFKAQHSTSHALLKFQTDIVQHLRQKQCTVACMLDVQKAFDSVWIKGLVYKINQIGFPPHIQKMICSFLFDRFLHVWIDNTKSQLVPVFSGVPQGTILGPKLFNLFNYDFPHENISENVVESKTILLADDTTTYAHDLSPCKALLKITEHINTICNYYQRWGITINPNKSQLICIRNASGKGKRYTVQESRSVRLLLGDSVIEVQDSVKSLGVNFIKLFKFNYHARIALNKSNKAYHSLLPLFSNKSLNTSVKLLMYKTLIRPILVFSFPNWFSISPQIIKEMEIFERKILRNCLNMYFESHNKRFSNSKIYSAAKTIPLSQYVTKFLLKFTTKLETHPNKLIQELFDSEINIPLQNTYYPSPINILHPDSDSCFIQTDSSHIPLFYQKVLFSSNRG